jgi:hypothetical protein
MYLLEMLRKTLSKKYVLNVTNRSRVKKVLKDNGRIHRAQKYFSTRNNKFEDIVQFLPFCDDVIN